MSEHTKGRLVAHPDFPGYIIPADQSERPIGGAVDADIDRNHYANIVATVSGKYNDYAANARRLSAAWNVCEGMTTEAIEKLPVPFAELGVSAFLDAQAELNAARALLREIIDAGGTVSIKLDDKVQSYLDACDKPGGA